MIVGCSVLLLTLTVIVASMRTTFQPWYLVVPMTFAVFLAHRYYIFIPAMILSFAALLTYVPYLYLGNWDKPVPQILANIYISAGILSVVAVGGYYLYTSRHSFLIKSRSALQKSWSYLSLTFQTGSGKCIIWAYEFYKELLNLSLICRDSSAFLCHSFL